MGNPPGRRIVPGSMGRPLPGHNVVAADPATGAVRQEPGAEGEICLRPDGADLGRPLGLMTGYRISPFELESVLIEHPAVTEAAVVPSCALPSGGGTVLMPVPVLARTPGFLRSLDGLSRASSPGVR